ncbi:MAG: DMT family transporter [Candidatus Thermoplasmatota archaeon]|nr:DMT family transporter [Candidatus Thermoplasmatota archaeon]
MERGIMEASMRRKAAWGLLVVTFAWGATFIWMKQAMNAIQPEIEAYGRTPVVATLVGGRFLIAFIALFLISKEARSALSNQQLWKGGAILGSILLVGFITQMIGLDSITPSTSAFLTSLYVVFTALITTALTGQKVTRTMILGVALATFGAGFIEGPPHLSWGAGEVLTVFCAFFFALHILYTQKITEEMSPIGVTSTSFLIVAVGSFVVAILTAGTSTTDALSVVSNDGVIVPLLCLGLIGSLFALLLLNLLQRFLHPVQAAIIYALEPVWATIFALGLGMTSWTGWIAVGGGALLIGNLMVELRENPDNQSPKSVVIFDPVEE